MHSHHLRNMMIRLFLGFILLPGAAIADQLLMKNGDIITGTVTKIVDDEVYIDPSYADEYAVDLAEVVSIEAEQIFEVELADGNKMDAQFAGATDGEQTLIVDGASMSIGMLELAAAFEPGQEAVVDPWMAAVNSVLSTRPVIQKP